MHLPARDLRERLRSEVVADAVALAGALLANARSPRSTLMKHFARVFVLASLATLTMVGCVADVDDMADEIDGTDEGAEEPEGSSEGEPVESQSQALYRGACPAKGRLSQGFRGRAHDGIDIANARGTAINATGPGVVTASGPARGYGQWIRIKHDDGSMTEYGHMYQRLVRVGQRVNGGQLIARMGSEGTSTGNHLHLRTYASASRVGAGNGMNPIDYLRVRGVRIPC